MVDRYYCHACSAERAVALSPHPVCRTCQSEFVERIEADNHPEQFREPRANNGRGTLGHADTEGDHLGGNPLNAIASVVAGIFTGDGQTAQGVRRNNQEFPFLQYVNNDRMAEPLDGAILVSMAETEDSDTEEPSHEEGPRQPHTNGQEADPMAQMMQGMMEGFMRSLQEQQNGQGSARPQQPSTTTSNEPSAGRPREEVPPQMQILNTILNVMRNQGGATAHFTFSVNGNEQHNMADLLGIHGNIGDYAMGQSGFDQIISRLMEQTGRSGPPPASEAVIATLKREKPKEVKPPLERHSECAICKDNFFPEEGAEETEEHRQKVVIKLPQCGHIFDEACIVHWLQVNETCPVCRKSVNAPTSPVSSPKQPNPSDQITPPDVD